MQIGTDTKWIDVTAGNQYTLGLTSNGVAWAWGDNTVGQLGLGSGPGPTYPVTVATGSTIVSLFQGSGAYHAIVIGVSRQTLCATGKNYYGQLGNGITFDLNNFNCTSAPLPVTLRYFNGRMTDAGALLGWATAREVNNARFHIERSRDAASFESIGSVPTQAPDGTSVTELTYTFTDPNPLPGLNYYRLSQTDRDGSRTVASRIIALNREGIVSVLFPNPVGASGEASVEPALGYVSYQISDMLGRIVQRADAPGLLSRVSVVGLPAGVYLVQVETSAGLTQFRVVR